VPYASIEYRKLADRAAKTAAELQKLQQERAAEGTGDGANAHSELAELRRKLQLADAERARQNELILQLHRDMSERAQELTRAQEELHRATAVRSA